MAFNATTGKYEPDETVSSIYSATNPTQGIGGSSAYVAPNAKDVVQDWAKDPTLYKDSKPDWATGLSGNTTATPNEAYGLSSIEQQRMKELSGGLNEAPLTEEQLYQNKLKQFQGEIDAVNKIYTQKLADTARENANRTGSAYAMQARGGLLGSDYGSAQDAKTTAYNNEVTGGVQAEQNLAIQSIMGNARKGAAEELAAKKAARANDYNEYIALLSSSAEKKKARVNTAAAALAAQGITLEQLSALDFTQPEYAGLDKKELIAAFNAAKTANDKEILSQKKTQSDIDVNTANIAKGNQFDLSEGQARYAIDPQTGKVTQIASKAKTYAPKSTGGGGSSGIYDQLDYRTANAVLAQGDKFGTSEITKKYNNIISASNLIAAVDPNTNNPAEHQALVYNFAKALDPDSVVREGEYATVKKYSQGLADKYKGEIKQAINGTGFLSPGAIQAIQAATDNRIKAYEPQYNNLKQQTAQRINNIAGKNIADIILLDYEEGYSGARQAPKGQVVTAPDGTQIEITE